MLLVFTHKITPRVTYTFKFLCKRILGIDVGFTSRIEDFIAHTSLKMSYAKQPLSNEIFVRSHDLLFETGVSDIEINVSKWEDTKGFFSTGERSDLPFDIFAASFYLISRYEEYLPHLKDEYGRFTYENSLAFNNDFLHQPIVDIWALKLKDVLASRFSEFQFPIQKFTIKPVIDVPSAFYFKHKGIMRTVGGTLSDLGRFKLKKVYNRYKVLLGFKSDPYDTFEYLIQKQKSSKYKFLFLFLLGEYSTFDKSISINKKKFVSLIKSVGDYAETGIKVSYLALNDLKTLKKEKIKFESVTNTSLNSVRHSYSKLNLPESYRHLIELEIHDDFTMGYINFMGFRAGTCTPFQFYDLDYEVQTPLQVNTYHCLDYTLLNYKSKLDKKQAIKKIINEVKNVNGTFIPVFHNYTFSDLRRWRDFKSIFDLIINS